MTCARSLRLVRLAGVTVILAAPGGCVVPIPAKATVTRTADLGAAGAPSVAVVYSADFAPETPRGLGRDMVTCVTRKLRSASEIGVVSEVDFFREIFAAEPGTVLLRRDTLPEVLATPHVAERLRSTGLTHVVLVGGATTRIAAPPTGGAGPGAVGVVLAATKSTRLVASILDLRQAAEVTRIEARAERDQAIVAGVLCCVPFMFGWIPMTESSSCDALGTEVARTLTAGRTRADR